MEPSEPFQQNNFLGDSFLNSKFFNPEYLFSKLAEFLRFLYDLFFLGEGGIIKGILSVAATFFLAVIAYSAVRLLEIRAKEKKHLEHEIAEYAQHQAERERKLREEGGGQSKNEKWVKVLQYIFSTNESDWKLAILEADTILDTLMGDLGFKGENLGEKLKSADREKFRNLTTAWEVHTIRNRIAHEGATFGISHHEAKRVISMYEQIFREFGYI